MADHPFEPCVSRLSSLVSEINASLQSYQSAKTAVERNKALEYVAQSSTLLSQETTASADAFTNFGFQPLANAAVRIAISIGLFENLPASEEWSIDGIAASTKAESPLVLRVVRTLAAFGILREDHDGKGQAVYSHTPFSLMYTDSSSKAWATWMHDVMINASGDIGSYFASHGPVNPTDAKESPFTWANKSTGEDLFAIVKKSGHLPLLNAAMSGSSAIVARTAVATYDFGGLKQGEGDVLIVDVGGGKGQTLKEIASAYPDLKGRMVVQDVKAVVDSGLVPGLDAEFQVYDFFEDVQPVKGAAAYFYQRIFHDWSDENCRKILRSLKPAMAARSKLLISDVVMPDHRPPRRKVLRDMNMLLVGGMERSESQWRLLLEGEGFIVEAFHGLHNPDNSIIEAVLK